MARHRQRRYRRRRPSARRQRQLYRRRRFFVGALLLLLFLAMLVPRGCGASGAASGSTDAFPAEEREEESVAAAPYATVLGGGPTSAAASASPEASGDTSATRGAATLVAGASDATNGPLLKNRMVAYYGHPFSARMGVLGEFEDPVQMVAALKEQAAVYSAVDPDRPAIPTIELIASVAQGSPGRDGLYLIRTPAEVIERYAKVAEENGCLLLLDVQVGLSTIAYEVEAIRPFLERPHVHLAIDPEYDMVPGQIPGQESGSSTGEEIMGAAQTLSKLVEEKGLPAKVLVVHQFERGMVTNKELLEPTPNVEVVLHADGFGTPEGKISKYDTLVRDEAPQYGGFKLFYQQDFPLLAPEEVLQLVPAPAIVSYQ